MKRMGMIVAIRPERIDEYKRLHAAVWPDILKGLTEAGITNYSIFLREPENLLFGYWEYRGTDFVADMAKMAAQDLTRQWWDLCMPCQSPLKTRATDEWWASMDEVFHFD